jgi:hypothetical protein
MTATFDASLRGPESGRRAAKKANQITARRRRKRTPNRWNSSRKRE